MKWLKSILIFIVSFLIYHVGFGCNVFPVDENNVLQVPAWYPILGILLSITSTFILGNLGRITKKANGFEPTTKSGDETELEYQGITYRVPAPITNEEYQRKRKLAEMWLEAHYDLNTTEGIQSIPERDDLPRPPNVDSGGFRNYTCDVDYYLRLKSGKFEEAGNIELAILCLKKSNAIRMTSRRGYRKNDYYSLVQLLAQHGRIDEAIAEKDKIDRFLGCNDNDMIASSESRAVKQIYDNAKRFETDLVIMSAHGASCPDCAKYQGRVFSLTGQDKRFPKLPSGVSLYRGVHPGCGHTFSTYIHGVNDPMLDYTLTFQTR